MVVFIQEKTLKNIFCICSCSALHIASENNFVECARILLDDGALVDALRGESIQVKPILNFAPRGKL
jgi:hypothetical protein